MLLLKRCGKLLFCVVFFICCVLISYLSYTRVSSDELSEVCIAFS